MDVSNLLPQKRRVLGSLRKIAVGTYDYAPPDSKLLRQGHPHQAGDRHYNVHALYSSRRVIGMSAGADTDNGKGPENLGYFGVFVPMQSPNGVCLGQRTEKNQTFAEYEVAVRGVLSPDDPER
jgi:hypothetical protein